VRTRTLLVAVAAMLSLAGSALAQNNFIANGDFNTDAGSWTADSAGAAIAFDAGFGNPSPGSMRLTNSAPGGGQGTGVFQCLGAVTAGKQYTWGGRMFFPSGQARTGNLQIGLRWYSGPGCTGTAISQPRAQTNAFDTWDPKTTNEAAPAGAASVFFVAFPSKVEPGGTLIGFFDTLFFRQLDGQIPPCIADEITLCLNNNRFSVTAVWQANGTTGSGTAVPLTGDTGTFWFFTSNNLEGIFKLVTGCPLNNFYWFFGGGLTNVKVTLRVWDHLTGLAKIYENPASTAFLPIQDTAGFPCP
jgi:hypothetical protein